jgi:hypothetical protein
MLDGSAKDVVKTFRDGPDAEFELFLAQKLGMTRARLREEMSADEFLRWQMYYARKAQREELERLKAGV